MASKSFGEGAHGWTRQQVAPEVLRCSRCRDRDDVLERVGGAPSPGHPDRRSRGRAPSHGEHHPERPRHRRVLRRARTVAARDAPTVPSPPERRHRGTGRASRRRCSRRRSAAPSCTRSSPISTTTRCEPSSKSSPNASSNSRIEAAAERRAASVHDADRDARVAGHVGHVDAAEARRGHLEPRTTGRRSPRWRCGSPDGKGGTEAVG
jgi:hypothetical protein